VSLVFRLPVVDSSSPLSFSVFAPHAAERRQRHGLDRQLRGSARWRKKKSAVPQARVFEVQILLAAAIERLVVIASVC
jgi:hypothetical protein